jgi:hypothetical protein
LDKRDSCGRILQAFGSGYFDDAHALVAMINHRLCDIPMMADWRESTLVRLMLGVLGALGDCGRLLWESQRRVRRGIAGGGRYRTSSVVPRVSWERLGVGRGTLLWFAGFATFSLVGMDEQEWPVVGDNEVNVVLEVSAESLVRVVRRGARGFVADRGQGIVPPFGLLRVCGYWSAWKRAVVDLVWAGSDAAIAYHGEVGSVGWGGREEADLLFRHSLFVAEPRARRNLERAAQLGHAGAMFQIGGLQEQGEGVSKDIVKTLEWYTKAAMQGHAQAMGCVGRMH